MEETAIREIVDPLKKWYADRGASQGFVDSITIRKASGLKIELVFDHPIAKWLEYGTKDHTINATDRDKGLRFQFRKTSNWYNSKASDSGDYFFGDKVEHPGFEGYQGTGANGILKSLIYNYKKNVILKTNQFLERSRIK